MLIKQDWWEPRAASPIAALTAMQQLQHLSLHQVVLVPPPGRTLILLIQMLMIRSFILMFMIWMMTQCRIGTTVNRTVAVQWIMFPGCQLVPAAPTRPVSPEPRLNTIQQLTSLALRSVHGLIWAPLAAYSAITASSTLQHLQLDHCCFGSDSAVWQHVFCPSRPPMLAYPKITPLDAPAFSAIAACCPGLESLNVVGGEQVHLFQQDPRSVGVQLQQSVQLQALLQLHSLTQLRITYAGDELMASPLAHMTQLKMLTITFGNDVTDHGLLQLTVLQQLTCLGLGGAFAYESKLSQRFDRDLERQYRSVPFDFEAIRNCDWFNTYMVTNKAPPGCPSDVWQQVQELYGTKDSGAQPS